MTIDFFLRRLRSGGRRFAGDDSGATAIEYGLIAALIAVVIITGLNTIGGNLSSTFTSIGSSLTASR